MGKRLKLTNYGRNAIDNKIPGHSSKVIVRDWIIEDIIEESFAYNVTECCVSVDIIDLCLPLCSYDANMTDIKQLASVCSSEFHKIVRCGAGGRNHETCCSRRGVPPACLSLCTGVIVDSLLVTANTCIPYIGNIVLCYEEGTELLPGPVNDLQAEVVDDTSVYLEWEPPVDQNNITSYEVHYQKTDNTSMHKTPLKLDHQIMTNDTKIVVSNLEAGAIYNVFVVSKNDFGSSLPSSIVMISVKKTENQTTISGVTSPPHSLAVASHSATWVTITWKPPEFIHPSEQVTYSVYHKSNTDESYQITNTTVTTRMLENLNPNTQYIVYVKAISKKGASLPSETLIAWTDPAYPAFVEPPTVHPINLVIEGSSMTILCIAMGTPMPTISLYISGRLVRQETTRHMVTVVHNVTKDMDQISCYADNGYGTPMQASRKITISHMPHIQASGITMAAFGDTVILECKVDAHPEPKMIFWRNHEERKAVIQGGKYDISIGRMKDEEDKYMMQLSIKNIGDVDVGDYYCHAENAFGSATQPVSVRIRSTTSVSNITQCCIEQNVSSNCMEACSFYLDVDAVIQKVECVHDFDKLIKCAADGSDHRKCCVDKNVPRTCLDFCRGEPWLNNKICVLPYIKQIMSCFHEGKDKLPGPPQNIRVDIIDSHSVKIMWDPPIKNPHTAEMYRVYWRLVDTDAKSSLKRDTPNTYFSLSELKDGGTYECYVKALNHRGPSTYSTPVRFTMGDKYITSAASLGDNVSHVGVAVGVVLALVVVAAIVVGAVWFIRTKNMGAKNQGGVAFENPSYLREVNMDHIQIPPTQTETPLASNGTANGIAVSAASGGQGWKHEPLHVPTSQEVNPTLYEELKPSGGQGWKHEPLHVPTSQEVNPTLYEELKLGQDGAGFKRLKP
ncbi:Fibronectin type III domain [Popillia japonica]|uniref:Fibronectin type III domain n=1 Tax=Popillia japonica TaxID=7064 RepID=A0AAW1M567_POPJA